MTRTTRRQRSTWPLAALLLTATALLLTATALLLGALWPQQDVTLHIPTPTPGISPAPQETTP